MRKLTVVLSLLLLLAGCQVWQPGGARYAGPKFSLTIPTGWTFTTTAVPAPNTALLASKEGILLQKLVVDSHAIKDPLPRSKRQITTAMSPFEIAEAVVDDLRSDRGLQHLELNENTPTDFGGRPGFKLLLQYQDADNLRLTEARYGALVGDRVYFLRYIAPSRHYFASDVAAFEEAARTFQFNKN